MRRCNPKRQEKNRCGSQFPFKIPHIPPLTEHPLIKVVGHVRWLLAVVQAVQIPAFRGGGVKLDERALPRDCRVLAEAVSLGGLACGNLPPKVLLAALRFAFARDVETIEASG